MTINREELEQEARNLLKGKTWKEYLIIAGVCLGMLVILNTGLVEVALTIVKLFFLVVGLFYLGKATYYGYPTWKKRFDEQVNSN